MPEIALTSRNKFRLPVTRLLVILTVTAFLEELLVLFLLDMLPPMRKEAAFLLDATLLAVLLFPLFYFLARNLCTISSCPAVVLPLPRSFKLSNKFPVSTRRSASTAERQHHRRGRDVGVVLLAEHFDQIPLFVAYSDEQIRRPYRGEEEMSDRHRRGRPEGDE